MPWDEPYWVDGFRSLSSLVTFQLRTWYHLKETNGGEVQMIAEWVNMAPKQLRHIVVLSGVRENEGYRIVWNRNSGEPRIQEIEDHHIAFI